MDVLTFYNYSKLLVCICEVSITLYVLTFDRCFREKYFMIGEENEKKEIDVETALEPDPRSTELLTFLGSLVKNRSCAQLPPFFSHLSFFLNIAIHFPVYFIYHPV